MERINDQLQLGTTQPYIKDLRNRVEEEQKDSKKQKSISFEGQLQDSLLNMTEMLYLYSQQHACLHKATPVNMSMWMGKLFKGPNLYEYLQAVNSCWVRDNQSSTGQDLWYIAQSLLFSPKRIYIKARVTGLGKG